jgi:hypothetical protein
VRIELELVEVSRVADEAGDFGRSTKAARVPEAPEILAL